MRKFNVWAFLFMLVGTLGAIAVSFLIIFMGVMSMAAIGGALQANPEGVIAGIFVVPVLILLGIILLAACGSCIVFNIIGLVKSIKHVKKVKSSGYAVMLLIISIIYTVAYLIMFFILSKDTNNYLYMIGVAPFILTILGSIILLATKKQEVVKPLNEDLYYE